MGEHAKAVVVVNVAGQPVEGATVRLNANDACGPRMGRTNGDGYVVWGNFPDSVLDSDVEVWAYGYIDYAASLSGPTRLQPVDQTVRIGTSPSNPQDVHLPGLTPSFRPVPSRSEVCGVGLTFQGLTVETAQYGVINWFEPWLVALTIEDRRSVYLAKRQAGDTHCIVEFFPGGPIYNEPPFDRYVSPDYEANPQAFRDLVSEIIQEGFTPMVVFDGDNADNPSDGYPNALRQLPILVDLFASGQDLNPYILYCRFWDGVFYGSTPENIQAFGQAFRTLLPNGYLAIEHNSGHIPVGGGPSDYVPGGRMTDYDVICSEFPNGLERSSNPDPDKNLGSQTWMVVDRMVRPWNRPADMPTQPADKWDPNPPYYLESGSSRGPYFYVALEYAAYPWVRAQISAQEIAACRTYLRSMGVTYTG